MVKSVSSLSSSGLKDFVLQRISAVLIALYSVFMVVYFIKHPHVSYIQWHTLVKNIWFQSFTLIVLVSLIVHAWVGLWTIFTDYVTNVLIRAILQCVVIVCFVIYFIWTISILWG